MIKLQKYLNSPRNFQNEITSKKSFIDLNNFLNKKIIETLFDFNIIYNSIINENKANILTLEKEQNEIYEILIEILKKKENNKNMNKNINGVKEKEIFEKVINNDSFFILNNKSNINSYINTTNDSLANINSNSNSLISSTNNSCQSSSTKKNKDISLEEEEKSLSLLSKEIKNENKETNRIHISRLNNTKIYDFLSFLEEKENKCLKNKINRQQVIQKIEEIINNNNNNYNEIDTKNYYLRKSACIKLYKAFSFLFKKYKIKDNKIKKFCRFIENKARRIDYEMGTLYKEYIIHILKNLEVYS